MSLTTASALQAENQRLKALLEFTRLIHAERDVRAQLHLLCSELRRASGASAATAMLFDPPARASCGLPQELADAWEREPSAPLAACGPQSTLPLMAGDEPLGQAVLLAPDPTPPDLEPLQAIVDEAATAILSARVQAESRRELRRGDALRRVVASIASELDLDSLLARVIASAVELLDADSGLVSLLEEDGTAHIRAVHQLPTDLVDSVVAPGEGNTGRVLVSRQAVIDGGVAVPVWWQSRLMGVVSVRSRDPLRTFSQQDREVMELLAGHIAIAIENARLYRELRDRLAEVTGLQAAGTALAEELNPERALRVVAEQALNLSGAASVSIDLLRPRGFELKVEVGEAPPSDGIASGSRLVLPLRARGRTLGTLSAQSRQRNAFHPRQLELLATFASQAAISLDNAQLYAELQSRLEEMVGLQRLGTLLLEEHDFDRVLASICRQLQRLTDAGGVGIALLEEDPRFLEMRTVVGPSADVLRGARIPTEGSFAAEALRTNRPQRSDDAQNDPRGYKQSLVMGNTRTILSVPMKTRQRTVGVLSIYNKEGHDGFTNRDAELATFFANQAAAAIENARLYEQMREYAVMEERNRLARDLHDSVTQSLFSVTLLSEAALNLLDRDPGKARERLERANELAQGALAEMRALIFQLRPMTLQEEGLLSALKKHLNALRSRHGRVVDLRVTGKARRLRAPVEDAAFRILQESLNNVVKHSEAARVQVGLDFQDTCLRVSTIDSGVGFDPSAASERATLGMTSMRERAEAVGGRLVVDSAPGRGTRVTAELPVDPGGAALPGDDGP